ncbi:scarecrow-like transcription factor PAT1 [Impatiens glandulifera]|uniref:scarecrow-like transcription factor PAT1 n=1 Tax=Impatiens glandulifera TaxID=253017 RepID=UPI001FB070D0|nr:scarecrow-like transcription factor PAT1 [Impatiens glandulifera]XP_047342407.1 scarecrow-like transcription factor PAT1 [Impatiens glandulifera]
MSNSLYYQPIQDFDGYYSPQFQTSSHQIYYNNNLAGGNTFSGQTTTSFFLNGNSMLKQEPQNSPDNYSSCVTDDANEFIHKLRELETVMLGPDSDNLEDDYNNTEIDSWRRVVEAIQPPERDLKRVLISCARAISDGNLIAAESLIFDLRQMVSVSGEPIQRLGAYMLEGLVARLSSSGSSIYKSLISKEPARKDLLSYMHVLYEVCPYFKFGYMSANGAIAEATKTEKNVHIIDFQINQGSQWVTLIQAFAGRPGGPPRIRITAIENDPTSTRQVGKRLAHLAKSFKVPFEFHSVVDLSAIAIRTGETIAVNFAFVLHRMPDESVLGTDNHRDRVLRTVKSLSPKVVTLVEQESNTNTSAFFPRFMECLDYYTAMFESIDVTLPRGHRERIEVEQHCLARDVVNVIACEGMERVERNELLGKWKLRFRMAGFCSYPLSSLVNGTIRTLLRNYSDKYRLEERDGALFLGWKDRDLVASCAWM